MPVTRMPAVAAIACLEWSEIVLGLRRVWSGTDFYPYVRGIFRFMGSGKYFGSCFLVGQVFEAAVSFSIGKAFSMAD